eukprot:scaffold120506_cov36-Tisochrysis_lutea.AAC.3
MPLTKAGSILMKQMQPSGAHSVQKKRRSNSSVLAKSDARPERAHHRSTSHRKAVTRVVSASSDATHVVPREHKHILYAMRLFGRHVPGVDNPQPDAPFQARHPATRFCRLFSHIFCSFFCKASKNSRSAASSLARFCICLSRS